MPPPILSTTRAFQLGLQRGQEILHKYYIRPQMTQPSDDFERVIQGACHVSLSSARSSYTRELSRELTR